MKVTEKFSLHFGRKVKKKISASQQVKCELFEREAVCNYEVTYKNKILKNDNFTP